MRRGRRPRLATWLDARYERLGFEYRSRALVAGLYGGGVVGVVGAALTLLYTPTLSFADLAIITAISICIYVADGTLALRPVRAAIAPAERWTRDRDEQSARRAWDALADLPFALLRQRRTYPVILVLLVVWDIVGVRRLDLSATSS